MENSFEVRPKPKTVKEFVKSWNFWKPFIAVMIGGIAGYSYYHFAVCSSGVCPITGNPYICVIWGSLLGFFMVNSPCSRGNC